MLYPMARQYNNVGNASESSLKVIGIESIPCLIREGNRLKRILKQKNFWD